VALVGVIVLAAMVVSPAAGADTAGEHAAEIPDHVMLGPADLAGARPEPVDPAFTHPLPPRPCPDGATVGAARASRSLQAVYQPEEGGRRWQVYQ
jgi:hypothetical protein